MISLLAWSKLHDITYSQAQKMFARGELAGAVREGSSTKVPAETKPKERQKVSCEICGGLFPQITGQHLSVHGTTLANYKLKFPHAFIVSSDMAKAQSERSSGRVFTTEACQKISDAKRGVTTENSWYDRGKNSASDDTRDKMSEAHYGKAVVRKPKA